MSSFLVRIERRESDPDYERKYAEWSKLNPFPYGQASNPPEQYRFIRVLEFEAEAEQFKAIRKAALEVL